MTKRITAFLIICCLSLEQCFAAVPLNLSPAFSGIGAMDKFRPFQLRSLIFDRSSNEFDLLVDKGDLEKAGIGDIQENARKLMEYFQVGISLPDSKFWVNLRPDNESEIIDPVLAQTDLGKVLLEADVALKKELAKATSPDTAAGRQYWAKLYAKAESLFGRSDISIPTLTRPWIVPGEIIIRQSQGSVYVYKAGLKVQLEQDRIEGSAYNFDDPRLKELNDYSSQLIRELILPALTKEVNSSRTFASLRQVYYSLILAQWFKRHFKGSAAEYAGRIDTQDLTGITSGTAWSKSAYFDAYRKSFSDGEYNRQENVSSPNGISVRKYVSGGILPMPVLDGEKEPLTAIPQLTEDVLTPAGVVRLRGNTLAPVEMAGNKDGGFADKEIVPDMRAMGTVAIANLGDRDIFTRMQAADLLGIMGFQEAVESLSRMLMNDPAGKIRLYAARALGKIGGSKAVAALIKSLTDETQTFDVRRECAEALGWAKDKSAAPVVAREMVRVRDAALKISLLFALIRIDPQTLSLGKTKDNIEVMRKQLEKLLASQRDGLDRSRTLKRLGEMGAQESFDTAAQYLDDRDPLVAETAADTIGKIDARRAEPYLIRALGNPDAYVVFAAAEYLGYGGGEKSVSPLLSQLPDWDAIVRYSSLSALLKIGKRTPIVPQLIEAFADASAPVRQLLVDLIAELGSAKDMRFLREQMAKESSQIVRSRIAGVTGQRDGGAVVNIEKWAAEPFTSDLLNPGMFRDYDFRSIGFDFKPRMGFLLGLQWATMALQKAQDAGSDNRTVILARDARKIEPELVDAIADALRYRGLNVVYVSDEGPNCVTSYSWAVQQYKPLMSIFLTASHMSEPKEKKVRGFKVAMFKKGAGLQSLTTREIKETSRAGIKQLMNDPELVRSMKAQTPGSLRGVNINENCVRMNSLIGEVAAQSGSLYDLGRAISFSQDPLSVLKEWEARTGTAAPLKGIKIVVEGSHTPSGILAAQTFKRLGAEVVLLHGDVQEVEGLHKADPSAEANRKDLEDAIRAEHADMGIAFDLDGDRGAIVVPVRDAQGNIRFELLAPDNMIVAMLSSFIEKWGYDPAKTGKQVHVIRDVLGTQAVNEKAAELNVETDQTDAGYVFLKKRRLELLAQGDAVVPIYGERSGHCWLDVTGEIENPIAVAVLFATMVKKEMYDKNDKPLTETPFFDNYQKKIIPYLQSPRFQPAFQSVLLEQLSGPEANGKGNSIGWSYDPKSSANPEPEIIALGRDLGVKAMMEEFLEGKEYAGGRIKVQKFKPYKDPPEEGNLYRFADIFFADENGEYCGRFVFRASSNDPTFVCSYEAPERGNKTRMEENAMLIGGIVLDWLEEKGFALVTVERIKQELGMPPGKIEKLNLTTPERHLQQYRALYRDGGTMSSQALIVQMDYVMAMLGIKDYPRIAETYVRSTNPVLVDELAKLLSGNRAAVLSAMDANPVFNAISARYKVENAGQFDPAEFGNKRINVEVKADRYAVAGGQQEIAGQPLSEYLKLMREKAATVPFVFRDRMERFVGRFLGSVSDDFDPRDLEALVLQANSFLRSVDLQKTKFVVTSGIGANEMYSHQLAQELNRYFKANEIDVKWIVVNNPAHLNKIPAEANNENTIVFEMSRSGTTKETVDFFNATRERFKTRIVAANSGPLKNVAKDAKDSGSNILIIDDTPGDIGGRQMNRKTLMVYIPLYIALSAGVKNASAAESLLRGYVSASLDANNELQYSNGLSSEAVRLAELLFRQRAAGRNKFSVVYDDSLRFSAKELGQLINEGGNKVNAGGTNNNILDSYSLQKDKARFSEIFRKAAPTQMPIFLLNRNSADYVPALAYIEELNRAGIPAIAITVDLGTDVVKNLQSIARTSALLQDMTVYFTYITNQDANSNPAVKLVREITAAMFDILKKKKAAGEKNINLGFSDVINKLNQKAAEDKTKARIAVDARNATAKESVTEFVPFSVAVNDLAAGLGLPADLVTGTLVRCIAKQLLKSDVGEAGGNKLAEIEDAFARSSLEDRDVGLGSLSPEKIIPSLAEQRVLQETPGFRVSVAVNKEAPVEIRESSLSEQLAEYFFEMYKQRKNELQYLTLGYMESDVDNPLIREIAASITSRFADLNITTPLLALPGVAHSGIEAVMSHPENVFNIAMVYTNGYGAGLGEKEIEPGITVDDATYVYGISNVDRMALAGTPNIIFEVKNNSQLPEIKAVVDEAMKLFRAKIDAGAQSAGDRDGGVPDMTPSQAMAAVQKYAVSTRVLVVEDDLSWAAAEMRILKNLGFTDIISASSLSKAVEEFTAAKKEGKPFCLVITDNQFMLGATVPELQKEGIELDLTGFDERQKRQIEKMGAAELIRTFVFDLGVQFAGFIKKADEYVPVLLASTQGLNASDARTAAEKGLLDATIQKHELEPTLTREVTRIAVENENDGGQIEQMANVLKSTPEGSISYWDRVDELLALVKRHVEQYAKENRRVLIVDEDKGWASRIQVAFQKMGFVTVKTAAVPSTALKMCAEASMKQQPYSLVTTDSEFYSAGMKKGTEFAGEIRGQNNAVPVFCVATGNRRDAATKSAFNAFVPKLRLEVQLAQEIYALSASWAPVKAKKDTQGLGGVFKRIQGQSGKGNQRDGGTRLSFSAMKTSEVVSLAMQPHQDRIGSSLVVSEALFRFGRSMKGYAGKTRVLIAGKDVHPTAAVFRALGFTAVDTADNAAQALEKLNQGQTAGRPYALVISTADLDAAAQIRKAGKTVPVIGVFTRPDNNARVALNNGIFAALIHGDKWRMHLAFKLRSLAREWELRAVQGGIAGANGGSTRDGGAENPLGGVAFQSLPMSEMSASPLSAVTDGAALVSVAQLDKQWREIRLELVKGGIPCLKMKEYIASVRRDRARLQAVMTCVAGILKSEEEEGCVTGSSVKEILLQLG
jgi:phosphomannomutase/HEAT repeat protein/CheY-like chemotaxis protein